MRVDRRLVLGGGLLAVLLIAVVLGVVLSRDSGDESATSGGTLPAATEAVELFRGIPQDGLVLGDPDAPVTVVEWVDLQCPFCRDFSAETLPPLVEQQVRAGKVRLELRGLAFLGPDSERGLRAVLAASRQNRGFELMELLYFNQGAENSGWLSQDVVEAAARSIPGIDADRLVDDMDSDAVSALLAGQAREAEERGVDSTPTIFVGPTGGELQRVQLSSPADLAGLEQAIAEASS